MAKTTYYLVGVVFAKIGFFGRFDRFGCYNIVKMTILAFFRYNIVKMTILAFFRYNIVKMTILAFFRYNIVKMTILSFLSFLLFLCVLM